MKHAHAHCAHKKLEYCHHCNVVWCHDCAAEFRSSLSWWGTTYTYGNQANIPGATELGYKTMTNAECPAQVNPHPHQHGG